MRQALELALEFIERVNKDGWILADFEPEMYNTITAIKEALAQPEQEPVIGTKTWFEDGKVVTQHLTAKDIYKEPEQIPPSAYSNTHQPEQEPVAWAQFSEAGNLIDLLEEPCGGYVPLYTTPPQRTWVGLTEEDKQTAFDDTQEGGGFWEFADAIEAKLKEKNT